MGEGLVEQAARSQLDRFRRALRLLRAARHQHDRQVGAARAQLVEELDARHLGHDDVADDEVERLLVEQLERMLRRGHALRLVAAAPQDLDRQLPHHRLVVDDQDSAHATTSAAGSRSSPPPVAATTASRSFGPDGERDRAARVAALERVDEELDERAARRLRGPRPRWRRRSPSASRCGSAAPGRRARPPRPPLRPARAAPGGVVLEADERLQGAHDLRDLGARALGQRDPVVQLRARLGVVEGQLRRADETHERVRDLVQRAPGQQAECPEGTRLRGVVRHGIYDPHADRRSIRPNL